MLRLPLAAMAFPVLRLRPRPQLDAFMDSVHAVVNADGEVRCSNTASAGC